MYVSLSTRLPETHVSAYVQVEAAMESTVTRLINRIPQERRDATQAL
jgi:hypothetical protein